MGPRPRECNCIFLMFTRIIGDLARPWSFRRIKHWPTATLVVSGVATIAMPQSALESGGCFADPPASQLTQWGCRLRLRARPAAHPCQQLRGWPGIGRQAMSDLHRLDRGAALLAQHAVDLADVEAGAHQQLLQLLELSERQLRDGPGGP